MRSRNARRHEASQGIFCLVNPQAGGGRGKSRWENVRKQLEGQAFRVREYITREAAETGGAVRDAVRDGFRTIVAAGGDGTLNDVLNAIVQKDGLIARDVVLGHIGLGSSNDFLRGVHRQPSAGLLGHRTRVNVIKLQCSSGETRYFLLNSSIGIVSRAIEIFNRSSPIRTLLRRVHTDTAVLIAGLSSLLRPLRFSCRVSVDGAGIFDGTASSVAVIKSPHLGGGMNYGTDYHPDDGRLTVLVIRRMNQLEMIRALPMFYNGTIHGHPRIVRAAGKRVNVDAADAPLVEADGELIGNAPARYSVLREFLTVRT